MELVRLASKQRRGTAQGNDEVQLTTSKDKHSQQDVRSEGMTDLKDNQRTYQRPNQRIYFKTPFQGRVVPGGEQSEGGQPE